MQNDISWGFHCHAAPHRAETNRSTGSLVLRFDPNSIYPDVTMFCPSPELASDLADAINSVLKAHAERNAPSLPAAAE